MIYFSVFLLFLPPHLFQNQELTKLPSEEQPKILKKPGLEASGPDGGASLGADRPLRLRMARTLPAARGAAQLRDRGGAAGGLVAAGQDDKTEVVWKSQNSDLQRHQRIIKIMSSYQRKFRNLTSDYTESCCWRSVNQQMWLRRCDIAEMWDMRIWRVGSARNAVFYHTFVASPARKVRS